MNFMGALQGLHIRRYLINNSSGVDPLLATRNLDLARREGLKLGM